MLEEKTCRLCWGDELDGPLVQPCACRGSAKWIHHHCLEQWRRTSPKEDAAYRCGQCKDEYRDALSIELLSERLQAKRTHGEGTASTLNRLASELQDQGKYDEAEPLYREVLEVSRETLGDRPRAGAFEIAAAVPLRRCTARRCRRCARRSAIGIPTRPVPSTTLACCLKPKVISLPLSRCIARRLRGGAKRSAIGTRALPSGFAGRSRASFQLPRNSWRGQPARRPRRAGGSRAELCGEAD